MSIFSLQSAQQLAEETGTPVDKRRFRANVYLHLTSAKGFGENEFVGRSLRIGSKVVIADFGTRLALHDDHTRSRYRRKNTGDTKKVAQAHEGMAGVYGAVLVEGMLHKGDSVELLD